ncbi:MAG TPA: homoserine kinase [Gemmatimonadaceae bacterium]|nr:homoserine kinase [Gemmatimonadaceae bacterium]
MIESRPMKARVKVPASTSNLGAGFDCVGVAVDRWLSASVEVSESARVEHVTVIRSGAVADLAEKAEDDLLHLGFRLACQSRSQPVPKRVDYQVSSTIPVARGLGASAAALIAGAMLANESLGLGLSREEIAALCSREEGHPDNIGPAVFGGGVLSINNREEYTFSPLRIHPEIALVFAVPEIEIETSAARAVLPDSLPYGTAVAAIAKSAALVQGLSTGDAKLLSYALDDVVHVPFRRSLIPEYDSVVSAAVSAGAFGATLSGSGSTMLAVAPTRIASRVGSAMRDAWSDAGQTAEVIIGKKSVGGATSG